MAKLPMKKRQPQSRALKAPEGFTTMREDDNHLIVAPDGSRWLASYSPMHRPAGEAWEAYPIGADECVEWEVCCCAGSAAKLFDKLAFLTAPQHAKARAGLAKELADISALLATAKWRLANACSHIGSLKASFDEVGDALDGIATTLTHFADERPAPKTNVRRIKGTRADRAAV